MNRRQFLFSMLLLPLLGLASKVHVPEKKQLLQTFISEIDLIEPVLSAQGFDNDIVARAKEIADAAMSFKSNNELISYLRKQIDSDLAQHHIGKLNGVTMPRTDLALQYLKLSLTSRDRPIGGS